MGRSLDSSKTSDSFDTEMIFLRFATPILFVTTCMDVFILAVSCREWMKKKLLSPTDKILALQGTVRIFWGSISMIWHFLFKFCPWIFQIGYVSKVLIFTFSNFRSCNVWLTASLCSYYCVKIADFRHPFFIHLKLRLSSKVVSTWLLGSAVLSFTCSLPSAFNDWEIPRNGNFSHFHQNKTVSNRYTVMVSRLEYALPALEYSAAFSICAISAALLLFSLWRHHQRMLGNWGSHRSPQASAHFQAVIIILSLLVIHVLVFVFRSVQMSFSILEVNRIVLHGLSVGIYLCGFFESLITILGNKKFRRELHRCLSFPKCRECVC